MVKRCMLPNQSEAKTPDNARKETVIIHYYVYVSLLQVPNLHQINPVHIFPLFSPHFFKIHFSITFLCTRLQSSFFPSAFPNKISYSVIMSSMCTTCLAHVSSLDFIIPKIFVKSPNYVLHYVAFITLLTLLPTYRRIPFSTYFIHAHSCTKDVLEMYRRMQYAEEDKLTGSCDAAQTV